MNSRGLARSGASLVWSSTNLSPEPSRLQLEYGGATAPPPDPEEAKPPDDGALRMLGSMVPMDPSGSGQDDRPLTAGRRGESMASLFELPLRDPSLCCLGVMQRYEEQQERVQAYATRLRVEGVLRQLAWEQLVTQEVRGDVAKTPEPAPAVPTPTATTEQRGGDGPGNLLTTPTSAGGIMRDFPSTRVEVADPQELRVSRDFRSPEPSLLVRMAGCCATCATRRPSQSSGSFTRSFCSSQGIMRNPDLLKLLEEVKHKKVKVKLPPDDELRFTPVQVLEALHRSEQTDSLIVQAVNGEIEWQYVARVLAHYAIALVMLLLIVVFLFSLLVFMVPEDVAAGGSNSQALTDPSASGDAQPSVLHGGASGGLVATASSVSLTPLWQLPGLSRDALRSLVDIGIMHNSLPQVLRVAAVARSASGDVTVQTAEGSTIRIESTGTAYLRPAGLPEVLLDQMTSEQADAFGPWLTSGVAEACTVWNG